VNSRITKKRTLQKAGLVHVAGWVRKEAAVKIKEQIESDRLEAEKAASNDRS